MKKEDMMKAATLYADDVCKGPRYRWGHEQVAMVDFIEGAKWRINSVWHDASETPISGKYALVKYITGDLKIKYRVDVFCGYEWKEMCHYDKLIQFAYIEDLIPNTEE